ncbi:ABC transporter substrate-binding protein [Pseudomonas alcaligenes]|uniref:ABC transporter substrate-binding protein n=1 Tax=Aquipseudomonas alcaligenes TaxID=43263 RepID=A0ABR7S1K8_AQUAC|nr:ABC transporter substrate-binding protein [Pseudomonas alcaligenes]MBC9250844.1 ABC transporter substrate-binding protein [Pseudomonas alcaligenes]
MRLLFVLSCCLLLAAPARAAEVVLSSSEDTPALRAFALALAERRPQDQVSFRPLAQLGRVAGLPADCRLILLDRQALDWRLSDPLGPPTLVLRVSRVEAQRLLGNTRPGHLSLLWSDPPAARQLALARLLLPGRTRIGVLYGTDSAFLLPELARAAAPLGLQIVAQAWTDNRDSRPLLSLLARSDLLLGLDDAQLYNNRTIKNLLLSSYAQQRILLGPSAGFVRAGSLASSYSDQDDWLATLDQMLDQEPQDWPRELYPSRFKVQSNRQVARALGIELADDAELARRLAAGENTP